MPWRCRNPSTVAPRNGASLIVVGNTPGGGEAMKTSKWAGLVMIAGSAMVFGCSKDAEQAANSND